MGGWRGGLFALCRPIARFRLLWLCSGSSLPELYSCRPILPPRTMRRLGRLFSCPTLRHWPSFTVIHLPHGVEVASVASFCSLLRFSKGLCQPDGATQARSRSSQPRIEGEGGKGAPPAEHVYELQHFISGMVGISSPDKHFLKVWKEEGPILSFHAPVHPCVPVASTHVSNVQISMYLVSTALPLLHETSGAMPNGVRAQTHLHRHSRFCRQGLPQSQTSTSLGYRTLDGAVGLACLLTPDFGPTLWLQFWRPCFIPTGTQFSQWALSGQCQQQKKTPTGPAL